MRDVARFFRHHASFDEEGLCHCGEVKVVIERVGHPDRACFNAAVTDRGRGEIGGAACLKLLLKVAQQRALIALDGKVIVSAARAQRRSDLALGEQGIGGDVFILEVQARKERNGDFDFVGLFEQFTCAIELQQADFFWA